MIIKKKGASEEQNKWVMSVYEKCGTIEAVYTFEIESGFRKDIVSPLNSNGSVDWGIAQLNSFYHWDFISSKDFQNPYKQIEYACDLWKGYEERGILGKRWYGYNKRHKARDNFIIY